MESIALEKSFLLKVGLLKAFIKFLIKKEITQLFGFISPWKKQRFCYF